MLAGGVGLAAATAITACSPPDSSSQGGSTSSARGGAGGNTLNAYLYQKPKLFSPLEPANGPDQIVMGLIFDSLLKVDPDDNLVPSLCTDMPDVSADASTFTYHLRKGLTWSDGEPFTSRDVLYTYNLLANPASGSAASGTYASVVGAKEVADGKADTVSGFSAPDDNTFIVKTTGPNLGFTALIGTVSILPEHVLGKLPVKNIASNEFFNKPTCGLGPYTFVTYETDQYVELHANRKFREPVNIDKIYLKPVTTDVAVAQLGTGEMDLVQISPTDVATVKKMQNVKIASKNGFGYVQINVNQDKPYLKDVRVRQAMLYAINRKALVANALSGQGSVLNSSFLLPAVLDNAKLNDYGYDPAKAKQLLKEAGWDPKQKVTLSWIPGQSDRDTAATVAQSQLKAIGMNVQLKKTQAAEQLDSIGKARSFDLTLGGAGNRAPDPWTVYNVEGCDTFFPDHGGNITHFCNKEYDGLMKEANQTQDETKRMQLYGKAAQVSNADPAFCWLYQANLLWAYSDRVEGFAPTGSFIAPFWNVQSWKIKS